MNGLDADTIDLLQRFGIAASIGLLIGVERGWREREGAAGSRVSGVRTYTLIAVFGALWAALIPVAGPWPLAAAGVVLGAGLVLFHWRSQQAQGKVSVTGAIVGMIAYALGAFAAAGDRLVAVAAAVVVVLVLVSRQYLHDLLRRITWPELRSGVTLLAMTFLALPVLPDRPVDPWGAFNPHDVWLFTVLMAAISYAGYVIVRIAKGGAALVYGSMAGALVSSTVVTLVNARLAAKGKSNQPAAAAAMCIAWMVSVLRMTAVAAVVNVALLPELAGPVAAAAVVLGATGFVLYRRAGAAVAAKIEFGNPFDLGAVLGLGALLAVIMAAVKLLNDALGQAGVLPLAAVSGFADVDPVAISMARMAQGGVDPKVAVMAILLAGATNLIAKMGIALTTGGFAFGLRPAGAGVAAILAGGAVVLLL